MTNENNQTRWFFKSPEGDNYYGRIYQGRTYQLIPTILPKLTIKGAAPYFDDGKIEFYPGDLLSEKNTNLVTADGGENTFSCDGSSGNIGGYSESYYTAQHGNIAATVMAIDNHLTVDLDLALKDRPTPDAFRRLLSFIATAKACSSLSSVNLQNEQYKDKIDSDGPIHVNLEIAVWVELGKFKPVSKAE